jgi:hypothetical protein
MAAASGFLCSRLAHRFSGTRFPPSHLARRFSGDAKTYLSPRRTSDEVSAVEQ